jgi:hypothetical protein
MTTLNLNFQITVNPPAAPPPPPLLLMDGNGNPLSNGQTINLQPETVGVEDGGQVLFTIKGGVAPYSYQTDEGAMPAGDSFSKQANADGSETVFLEGTPSASGPFSFSIQITDSAGQSVTVASQPAQGNS